MMRGTYGISYALTCVLPVIQHCTHETLTLLSACSIGDLVSYDTLS